MKLLKVQKLDKNGFIRNIIDLLITSMKDLGPRTSDLGLRTSELGLQTSDPRVPVFQFFILCCCVPTWMTMSGDLSFITQAR